MALNLPKFLKMIQELEYLKDIGIQWVKKKKVLPYPCDKIIFLEKREKKFNPQLSASHLHPHTSLKQISQVISSN